MTQEGEEPMPYGFQSIYFDRDIVADRILDIFLPEKPTRETALFLVHGGGWLSGSRTGYHQLMRAFNKQGFICAATEYRKTNITILDQITDVRHGYDIFMNTLTAQGRAPRVCLFGSSAGAHLAALLAQTLPGECGESVAYGEYVLKNPWIRPVGAVLESAPLVLEPWEEMFPHLWTAIEKIVGIPYAQNQELYRRVSPMNHLSNDMPPILLLEAEKEHAFPLEQRIEFIAKVRSCGCRADYKLYTNAEHGFFYDVTRRQQKEAFNDILSFIESLNSSAS
jgi:acetyl esterase/lipase